MNEYLHVAFCARISYTTDSKSFLLGSSDVSDGGKKGVETLTFI